MFVDTADESLASSATHPTVLQHMIAMAARSSSSKESRLMKQKKLFRKKNLLRERARRALNPNLTDEERDRNISELIAKGMEIVDELDPIVRETYRDDPEKLAEWEEIMRMLEDPEEEEDK
jgi:hypothetical protein